MPDYERTTLSGQEFYPEALAQPVPNMDQARPNKIGYGAVPIDEANPLYDEPLIKLSQFFIDGQSYYSRPNAATGEPVAGVDPEQYLRISVARMLKELDDRVQSSPEIATFFGGVVRMYVQDALRPVSLQQHLYDEVFPRLIRDQNPGLSDDQIVERRSHLIAKPSTDKSRPSPHATGGVFDLELRYVGDGLKHQAGDMVEVGHTDGDTSERVNPDYFETHPLTDERDALAQRNRRAFYAIMTGAAFGIETNFVNNPTEWWHWGKGDQLSARVSGQEFAVYSLVEPLTKE